MFTNLGEFQKGKGNKKTRLGPKMTSNLPGQRDRRQTPNEIAINKFGKVLERHSVDRQTVESYKALISEGEHIRFMNMQVLGEVAVFLMVLLSGESILEIPRHVIVDNFTPDKLSPFVDPLIPTHEGSDIGGTKREYTEEEMETMKLRMSATFVRYAKYVAILVEERRDSLQVMEEAYAEGEDEGGEGYDPLQR